MKKEKILSILKDCNIHNYYVHSDNILVVTCEWLGWEETEKIAKHVLNITTWEDLLRISIDLG